jgi:hypothetical protein
MTKKLKKTKKPTQRFCKIGAQYCPYKKELRGYTPIIVNFGNSDEVRAQVFNPDFE